MSFLGRAPASLLAAVTESPGRGRSAAVRQIGRALDACVPGLLDAVLRRAGLTEVVLRYVDLDAVVGAVDLDAAAERIDVDAVARRLDVDAVAGRLDIEAVLDQLDLTELVLVRVDLARVVDAALARMDLTDLVLDRVDLGRLAEAVLAEVDLVGVAEEVIDGVDLTEIIRESTGSMASDTVRDARMQSIAADQAVGRAVDRLLLRRRREA